MVKFQHTELLMDGELYLEPLRTAKVSAVYTCTDGAQGVLPQAHVHGIPVRGVTGIEAGDLELSAPGPLLRH